MFGKRFGDGLPTELEADEKLRDDDSEENPALPTQFITLRVVQQLESLPKQLSNSF